MNAAAKQALLDEHSAAVVLARAARNALGPAYVEWEPESVWVELDRQGVDVPETNRAKLMVATSLALVPSFYWDGLVFEKAAIAMDDRVPNPDALEDASPAQLAWAVVDAGWVLKDLDERVPEWQHEPRGYAGVSLLRAGFVLAPHELSFAQEMLDRTRHHTHLLDEVSEKWALLQKLSTGDLADLELEETPLDVQIARLVAVELHVRERRAAAEVRLAGLGK